MPTEQTPPAGFEPLHSAHSIEQVSLTVQFAVPLSQPAFNKVLDATRVFEQELPAVNNISTTPVIGQIRQVLPGMGRQLMALAPNGVADRELRVQSELVSYLTTAYPGWNEFWHAAQRYFAHFLPMYVDAQMSIANVSVLYVDKFIGQGRIDLGSLQSLLRRQSNYIPPQFWNAASYWHCHTGRFDALDDRIRRLTNVNIDVTQELKLTGEIRDVFGITTALADNFDQPDFVSCQSDFQASPMQFVQERFESLHVRNKEIVSDILNDETCVRIGLRGRS